MNEEPCLYGFYTAMEAQSVKNLPAVLETRVQSRSWANPLEKEMVTTPVFLPAKSHGQRSLVSYSPWVATVRHDLVTKPPPETDKC